jgi:hypothetical protein
VIYGINPIRLAFPGPFVIPGKAMDGKKSTRFISPEFFLPDNIDMINSDRLPHYFAKFRGMAG